MLQEKELYWLAGLLEGEASFLEQKEGRYVSISLEMTDEDIIKKVAKIFNVRYSKPSKREPHHKQSYKLLFRGSRAVEMMKQLQPLMGIRRSEKIQECIDSFKIRTKRKIEKENYYRVVELYNNGTRVEEIGRIFGITKWRVYQIIREVKTHK